MFSAPSLVARIALSWQSCSTEDRIEEATVWFLARREGVYGKDHTAGGGTDDVVIVGFVVTEGHTEDRHIEGVKALARLQSHLPLMYRTPRCFCDGIKLVPWIFVVT